MATKISCYSASKLGPRTILEYEELVDHERLAGEDMESARLRMHRELDSLYGKLEVGMRQRRFLTKYFEYGAAALQHRAACCDLSNFSSIEIDFQKMIDDVKQVFPDLSDDWFHAEVNVRVALIQSYMSRKHEDPQLAKKHGEVKTELLQDLRQRPQICEKRIMPFWLEKLAASLTPEELYEFQAKPAADSQGL